MDRLGAEREDPLSGSVALDWHGERWRLLPARAAFRFRGRWLVITDPHFGKAATFRAAGIHCPEPIDADLERLDTLIDACGAERLVILGDLFHSAAALAPAVLEALSTWRGRHAELPITLVRGNHDRAAGDPPADLGMGIVDEGVTHDGVTLVHDAGGYGGAAATSAGPTLAGHVHPAVTLPDAGRVSVRLPCFRIGEWTMTLPAFGSFTGMHTVRGARGDRRFAIAPERVFEVPRGTPDRRRD